MMINTNPFTHILVAEDDATDFESFVEAFETIAPGIFADRAKNGLECINLVKENVYDVVFLDLNMPIKNGFDCLKYVKENETNKTTPVIIYSTSHYLKHIDASYKMGAHYYIIKPGNPNDLPAVLHNVLNRLLCTLKQPGIEDFVVGLEEAANISKSNK